MKINANILLPPSDQERAFEIKDASEAVTVEIIASDVDSSGVLTFGLEGALYVTEAGGGGYRASIPSFSLPDLRLFHGETGAITRIQDGKQERICITADADRVTITNELISPAGLTIGSDIAICICDQGFTGEGQVVRIENLIDTSFSLKPLYQEVEQYTTIAADGDPTDIYFPVVTDSAMNTEFPIALMLQGALVDKADYSNFAEQVASYGFVVVVPNNERTITNPATGQTLTGLLAEQEQVNDVLEQIVIEDANSTSPIFDIVDTEKLGLLGHSFGGAAGLGAIQEDIRIPGLGSENYSRPPELMAGIFYGTSFRDPITDEVLPVNNDDIPTGLIVGDRDGVIKPNSTEQTYDQILNPPKALITIEGANHYGITNEDNLVRDPSRPTLDQATATETIARWSGLFLRAHLLCDKGAFHYVYNMGDACDPNVDVISQTQSVPEFALL